MERTINGILSNASSGFYTLLLKTVFLFGLISTPSFAESVFITQGFEEAGIPPTGWSVQNQTSPPTAATWLPASDVSAEGNQSAFVRYPGADPVDAWLLSPAFTLENRGVVHFASFGNKNLCLDQQLCKLEVWAVSGAIAGDADDQLLLAETPFSGIFALDFQFVEIPAGLGEIRIGFRYISTDGAAVYIDAVEIRDYAEQNTKYEAAVLGQNEITPPNPSADISGTAKFDYNFSTRMLSTFAVINNPGAELVVGLQLYEGTTEQEGVVTHNYGIANSASTTISHSSEFRLTLDQRDALLRGSLFMRVIYLFQAPNVFAAARGQLVQNLPISTGFESGIFPPDGWLIEEPDNSEVSWDLRTGDGAYEGSREAFVLYPGNTNQIDTWLVSPPFIAEAGTPVTFASLGNTVWCKIDIDNCDLEVWIIFGDKVGDGNDIMLGLADDDWTPDFVYEKSLMTIAEDRGPVRTGFRLIGADADTVYLDAIQIGKDEDDETCFVGKAKNQKVFTFCI